jgi:DNA-nicking Smr family endonuclease
LSALAGALRAPDDIVGAMDQDLPPVRIPITGELDLHTFRPAEAASSVEEYLRECRRRGLPEVRIIHGKGTGALRETVHACLRRSLDVAAYRQGDEFTGGWGATLVTLKPPPA